MNRLITVLLCGTFGFMICSCETLTKDFESRVCHYDGAYEAGSNDADAGKKMNGEALVIQCPQKTQASVRKGYREGFNSKRYDSQTNLVGSLLNFSSNNSNIQQKCITSYGKKTCGFDCKEAYGKVKCARVSSHNCIEAYGKIQCGQNCREAYGKINCEKYE